MKKITLALVDFATSLTRSQKALILMSVDVLLVPTSLMLAIIVAGGAAGEVFLAEPRLLLLVIMIMAFAALVFSNLLGLPRVKLNSYEQTGIQSSTAFAFLVGAVGFLALIGIVDGQTEVRTIAIFTMILTIASVSSRFLMRSVLVRLYQRGSTRERVLIYGAGQTGVQLALALHTDDAVMPVAFVDDNKTLQKITVAGLSVYSPAQIKTLMHERSIDRVVLAMPSLGRPRLARLTRRLEELGCDVSALPSFAALIGHGTLADRIQPVRASEFLGREGLECDLQGHCGIYAHKSIMITGAGGSIGSELTRQIIACRPSRLVLFESSEHALYQIDHELSDLKVQDEGIDIVSVLGSVTDPLAVRNAIAKNDVEIVLHAAAYKHVPLVEQNRLAGLNNNVIGTKVVAEAARDAELSHFILISTDKAVHPTNMMGASKRLAELFVRDLASKTSETLFGIVRFGNVLGSSGSVVPLFEEQIARGGPVTLTHAEVTRYFMTLSEAARLVLLSGNYVSNEAGHGDIFLLDMGHPVPIRRLAEQMIEAAGYTVCDMRNPSGDIEIVITGLRPGEKIHEELAMQGHAARKTDHPKIMRIEEPGLSEIEVATATRGLIRSINDNDAEAAEDIVNRWIAPNYEKSKKSGRGDGQEPASVSSFSVDNVG